MALRVWLPLNGDLHNQGTSNHKITLTDGNTWTSPGKIGNNALTLTKLQLIVPSTSCMSGAKEISYAYWIKVNTAWSANWLDGIRWIETDGSATSTARQEFYTNCTLIGTWYNGGAINGKAFTPGVWTHLAGTFNYNTGEAKFYINGVLSGSTTNVNTAYYCRGDFCIGDNGTDICENDVRIYDHCLSAAEVHEISQGLVLHYKLDNNGHRNLFQTDPTLTITIPADATSAYSSYVYIDPIIKNNGLFYEGAPYTVTYDYVVNSNDTGSAYVYTQLNTARSAPSISQTMIRTANATGHVIETFYVTQAQADYSSTFRVRWRINTGQAGNSITIKNVRLYLGTQADINYISDSSGYSHNGTIAGNPTIITSPKRYSNCTHFGANTAKIQISNLTTTGFGSSYSFVWWGRRATHSGMMFWGFLNGIRLNGMYNGTLWNTGDGSNNPIYKIGTTTTITAPTATDWHHYAMTGNGTKCYLYIDGELYGEAKTWKAISGTEIWLNGWDSGTSYTNTDMDMSDFRIYCTTLSADDILQLYHTSAKVDNKQNLHTFELVENNSKIQINKCGQTLCNELEEEAATKFYKTNQIIETNEIIEF